jgi:hypothetical protein
LGEGSFAWLPQFTNEQTLGYRNGDILVVHNFSDESLEPPAGELILRSGSQTNLFEIEPNETIWVKA